MAKKDNTIVRSIYYYNALVYCRDIEGELKKTNKTSELLKDVFSKIKKMQAQMNNYGRNQICKS